VEVYYRIYKVRRLLWSMRATHVASTSFVGLHFEDSEEIVKEHDEEGKPGVESREQKRDDDDMRDGNYCSFFA